MTLALQIVGSYVALCVLWFVICWRFLSRGSSADLGLALLPVLPLIEAIHLLRGR